MSESETAQAALADLMKQHSLTEDARLYRYTLPEYLTGETDDTLSASANPVASEAVINVYEGGHIAVAEVVGAGLAFSEVRVNQWAAEGRIEVEVRLGDVLSQGGLVYPVESVITERVWYLTIPTGTVAVRAVR